MNDQEYTGKLRWQCRRGIKEVEVILLPFYERFYAELSGADKQLFVRLLGCHDVDLFEWFTSRSTSKDGELQGLVNDILARLAAVPKA